MAHHISDLCYCEGHTSCEVGLTVLDTPVWLLSVPNASGMCSGVSP